MSKKTSTKPTTLRKNNAFVC